MLDIKGKRNGMLHNNHLLYFWKFNHSLRGLTQCGERSEFTQSTRGAGSKWCCRLNLHCSSSCTHSLKRRNKHTMVCLVVRTGVKYPLQPLFPSSRVGHSDTHARQIASSYLAIASHRKQLASGCSAYRPSGP